MKIQFKIRRCFNLAGVFLILLIAALGISGLSYATQIAQKTSSTSSMKNILIIHSDEEFIPANIEINQTFATLLKSDPQINANLFSEYIDNRRLTTPELYAQYIEALKVRYAINKPDVIIAVDLKAYNLVFNDLEQTLKGIPVVFCMLPEGAIKMPFSDLTTGNYMNLDGLGTAELILKVHPHTKRLVVVSGVAPSDIAKRTDILNDLKSLEKQLEVVSLDHISFSKMQEEVSSYDEGTVVLYVSIFQDVDGNVHIPREALKQLSERSKVPIYGIFYTNMAYGLAGGSLFEFKEVAEDAAEKSLEILKGTPPSSLPIRRVTNQKYMNWAYMQKWQIPESSVPKDVIVVNKQYTFFELYYRQIFVILGFVLLETVFSLFLIIQLRRRKAAETRLNELNDELEHLVEVRTEALTFANQELVLAEKHSAMNQLLRNLLHRLNTPLGNTKVYLEMLQTELGAVQHENDEDAADFEQMLQKVTSNQMQVVEVMNHLKIMLEIESEAEDTTVYLPDFLNAILYDNFATSIDKSKSIILICYPDVTIKVKEKNLRIALSALVQFADYQRRHTTDLPPAELLIMLENNILEVIYIDMALDQIENISTIFDPFSFNDFKTSASGLELTILYNCITIGLTGAIGLKPEGQVKNAIHMNFSISEV